MAPLAKHRNWATKVRDCRHIMKMSVIFTLFACSIASASAQTSSPTEGPAFSPAKSIGMYAYPKNQQNADQQLKDESQCYGSAKQQTGVDPQSAATQPNAEQQKAQQQQAAQQAGKETPKGGTVKGGAGGAAGGAVIGAVGDAGKGAGGCEGVKYCNKMTLDKSSRGRPRLILWSSRAVPVSRKA